MKKGKITKIKVYECCHKRKGRKSKKGEEWGRNKIRGGEERRKGRGGAGS